MTEPANSAAKQRGKPFRPGQSGNPAGKPRGARHKVTLAIESLLEGEAEALTRKAVEMALAGDGPALRLCLDRLAPSRKDAPISIDLPAVEGAAGLVEAGQAILAAVASGEITPAEAEALMGLIERQRRIVETADLEARLAALEGETK